MNHQTIGKSIYRPPDIAAFLDAGDRLPAAKLCLEFANTADWHASEHPVETLTNYEALVDWSERIGLLSAQTATDLRTQAKNAPALAEQIHLWAVELREALYRIFAAVAVGDQPAQDDIELLNEALPLAFANPTLMPTEQGFAFRYRTGEGLDQMLWPILRSAALLLTSPDLDRVGQCADDRGCGFLFFDTSRNRSRRWCDMSSCGNRAKARRHYARVRADEA